MLGGHMRWMACFLWITGLLVADTHRPDGRLPDSYPGIFNAPASVEVVDGWDLFATTSAIYWRVSQDYMDAGRSAEFAPRGSPVPAQNATSVYPTFEYQPGFKVGVGAASLFDHWSALLQYTWLHQKTSSQAGSVPSSLSTGQTIWVPNDWFNTLASNDTPTVQASQIRTDWKMDLDQLDLLMTLPFYESPSGIIYHYGGIRALWIDQNYTVRAVLAEHLTTPPAVSDNSSQCWSAGLLAGIGAHSLLKWGFRLEGMTKISLLYTRFTKLSHQENDQGFGASPAINGSMAPYGCIRPVSELGIGLGWGSYVKKGRYHLDLAARYDFNIFWNQNMLRQTVGSLGDSYVGYANTAGNLYLHGLSVDACLNF